MSGIGRFLATMGWYRKAERGSVSGLFSMLTLAVIVLSVTLGSSGGALAQNGNAASLSSNATTLFPASSPTGPFSALDEIRTVATAAPYIPPGGHECTSEMRQCRDGMILPAWRPIENISAFDKAGRATVYILVLFYLFLGVSIIADRFMAAIEVITSTEREVTILRYMSASSWHAPSLIHTDITLTIDCTTLFHPNSSEQVAQAECND